MRRVVHRANNKAFAVTPVPRPAGTEAFLPRFRCYPQGPTTLPVEEPPVNVGKSDVTWYGKIVFCGCDPAGGSARGSGVLAYGFWAGAGKGRSEEHTSELQSQSNLVCRL